MFVKIAILSTLVLSTVGCSNSNVIGGPAGLTNANLQPVSTAKAADPIDIETELSTNKTLAGRMLTAIALERVTGRKPDPARLSKSN